MRMTERKPEDVKKKTCFSMSEKDAGLTLEILKDARIISALF